MDIEEQNIQIMIKMIIDKLHNETLKEYYKKLSTKRGEEIEEKEKTIVEQNVLLNEKDVKIHKQDNLQKEKEEQIKDLTKQIQDITEQLRDETLGAAEKVSLLDRIKKLEDEVKFQNELKEMAIQATTGFATIGRE